jgi:hypothetical protein
VPWSLTGLRRKSINIGARLSATVATSPSNGRDHGAAQNVRRDPVSDLPDARRYGRQREHAQSGYDRQRRNRGALMQAKEHVSRLGAAYAAGYDRRPRAARELPLPITGNAAGLKPSGSGECRLSSPALLSDMPPQCFTLALWKSRLPDYTLFLSR